MAFLFDTLKIADPTYLDIGANNPIRLSNTYYFYQMGSRVVCSEPNPVLSRQFRSIRPRNNTLNDGISPKTEQSLPFYLFGPGGDGVSTFCKDHADHSKKPPHSGSSKLSRSRSRPRIRSLNPILIMLRICSQSMSKAWTRRSCGPMTLKIMHQRSCARKITVRKVPSLQKIPNYMTSYCRNNIVRILILVSTTFLSDRMLRRSIFLKPNRFARET